MIPSDPETRRSRPTVVFVVPWLRHYNEVFLRMLRRRLDHQGVTMEVVYGMPEGVHDGRGDTAEPPWGIKVHNRSIGFGRYSLTWQPYVAQIRKADLVIAQQASRHILTYVLLVRQALGGPRVAFWGHGKNFQATSPIQAISERIKRWLTGLSHWFFAYNDMSASVLLEMEYPESRISVVNNSVDTSSLTRARDAVTPEDKELLRASLGLIGDHVGIFCGAMYPEKRIDFLIQAAVEVRSRIPDFELICVGDGVDRPLLDSAATQYEWIHPVGAQFGEPLARHFALASVYLLPGLVGLTVLDSFVFETPMVTTSSAMHSPEIEYLDDGENGLIVEEDSVAAYADEVTRVLTDESLHSRLVQGCRRSAADYSMEEMVERFSSGVVQALATR